MVKKAITSKNDCRLYDRSRKYTQKGGTMRLGGYDCSLVKGTQIAKLFGVSKTRERHRHRLEVQNEFVPDLEKKEWW
ncbi:hypothetical protein HC766_01345 [Candidatus Gracilibacteria bacterium]|nr:hypothetical protein [Candidatus Gracilibacteria bacterium]